MRMESYIGVDMASHRFDGWNLMGDSDRAELVDMGRVMGLVDG